MSVVRPAPLYRDLLYRLLPEHYRARDGDGELHRFLALLGDELDRVAGNIEQLASDFHIDSCQEWVIPYLADLVATNIVFNDGARNRADVRHTIGWRRRKGTRGGLEDVAREISGWGARVLEGYERLLWTQRIDHVRPRALHTPRLADGAALARVGTAFDEGCYTVDLRPAGVQTVRHRVSTLMVYLAALRSHAWRGATPAAVDAERYRFHPLGRDTQLYAGGDRPGPCVETGADFCHERVTDFPIRLRDFHDHAAVYIGTANGFTVREDGLPICGPAQPVESRSERPAGDLASLDPTGGVAVADPGLFLPGPAAFRIRAVRYGLQTTVVDGAVQPVPPGPARSFGANYVVRGGAGGLDTTAFAFTPGLPFDPAAPNFDQPTLLLGIEPLGAVTDFPECELIVTSDAGHRLLVFLPALTGLVAGTPLGLYAADDGSTYFARDTHDAGLPDLNPDSAARGAFRPAHLARAALGQIRPRPGIRPVRYRRAVARDLCCWDRPLRRPLAPDEVAFDPARGRFAFPLGQAPAGRVTVDFRFGLTGEIGAGPFPRDTSASADLTVAQDGGGSFRTVQEALAHAVPQAGRPVVIEIRDSRTYVESLSLAGLVLAGGLILRAAPLAQPVIRSAGGPVLASNAATTLPRLELHGVVLAGGDVELGGGVRAVALRWCSLDPESVALRFAPAAPDAAMQVARTIAGPVTLTANVATLAVTDTVIQHPAATVERPDLGAALTSDAAVTLARSTIVGRLRAAALTASNALLYGPLELARAADSCLRYSRHPSDVGPVPRFRTTAVSPIFASLRQGDAGYAHLHPRTDPAIRRGGENGGEIGAFHGAELPWREQNVGLKFDEYLPAGLVALPVRVYPKPRFPGVPRL